VTPSIPWEKFVRRFSSVLVPIVLLSSCAVLAQQSAPNHPAAKSPKLCAAAIGNGSLKPIQVNEVKEELVKKLLAAGLNVDSASSATLVAKKLELSGNNQESIRLRKCDYMLLTAVDSAKPSSASPAAGAASSDSGAGSQSGLLLSFALFKRNVAKPLLDTSLEAPGADTPTQAILKVIDKEVEQVRQSITKK
jgi:hypothetical protein